MLRAFLILLSIDCLVPTCKLQPKLKTIEIIPDDHPHQWKVKTRDIEEHNL